MSELHIAFDVKDRLYGPIYEPVFNLPALPYASLGQYSVKIANMEFSNTVYPLRTGNNKLVFSENDTATPVLTITMDDKLYTGTSLATDIASKMTSISSSSGEGYTYTGTYDSDTKKISISAGGTFKFDSSASNMFNEIGFSDTQIGVASYALSVTSAFPIDISGTAYVDIESNLAANSFTSEGRRILARIPVVSSFGNVIFHENESDDFLGVLSDTNQQFALRLRDDQGRAFVLPDNAHLSFKLLFKLRS